MAAKKLVNRDKAVAFMRDALADEYEVHEVLTKIIRGENICDADKLTHHHVLTACKELGKKFLEEKKMAMLGKTSMILEISAESAGAVKGQLESGRSEDADYLALKEGFKAAKSGDASVEGEIVDDDMADFFDDVDDTSPAADLDEEEEE